MGLPLPYSQKKIPVHLTSADCLTVGHLSDAIHKETGVNPICQKLIYKGRTLANANLSLPTLGLRDGDRIMLLSRKNLNVSAISMEHLRKALSQGYKGFHGDRQVIEKDGIELPPPEVESGSLGALRELQNQLEMISSSYDENSGIIMTTTELAELKLCKKSFMILHEDSMKLLERVDSTSAQTDHQFRNLRKVLVNALQSKMDQCEKRIDELSEKIKDLEQKGH